MNKIRAIDIPSTYSLKLRLVNFVHFTHFRYENWKNINYCIKFTSLFWKNLFSSSSQNLYNLQILFTFQFPIIQIHPYRRIVKKKKKKKKKWSQSHDRTLVSFLSKKQPSATTFICRNQCIETGHFVIIKTTTSIINQVERGTLFEQQDRLIAFNRSTTSLLVALNYISVTILLGFSYPCPEIPSIFLSGPDIPVIPAFDCSYLFFGSIAPRIRMDVARTMSSRRLFSVGCSKWQRGNGTENFKREGESGIEIRLNLD